MNGTWINEVKLESGKQAELRRGDIVYLCPPKYALTGFISIFDSVKKTEQICFKFYDCSAIYCVKGSEVCLPENT